ncbi:hypothetical protein DUNSADRAFT_11103 [Dunaliella salina]|uniref:OB domain-containing protein n=1 Tax=Dunaliella salina TaxID=3046 RepID=A0ABQ7H4L0_DUNSA|nr:hypothetical protein DUNSADRAFT_11103 [Dunaliella salina]|eukprot:KAF5841787.1 hypothetical protein DUNSADRAFT_11103 [Dunaliella salina]
MRSVLFSRHRLPSLGHSTQLLSKRRGLSLPLPPRPLVPPAIHMSSSSTTSQGTAELSSEVEALRKQLASLQSTLQQKEAQLNTVWPYSKSYGRTTINTIIGAADGGKSLIGRTLRVGGWIKTGREAGAGAFAFLEVNDGSCFESIQVMMSKEVAEQVGGLKQLTPTGTSVLVEGELTPTPEGTKQAEELKASVHVLHMGH